LTNPGKLAVAVKSVAPDLRRHPRLRRRAIAVFGIPLFAALLLLALFGRDGRAASTTTPFGCDAPGRRVCYFSVQFAFGGVRSFSLRQGERTTQSEVTPGVDRYQMSLDLPNFGDVNRCRTLSVQGHPCRAKLVDPGYND